MIPTILVAGIGNIFLGDDAFGVEVAQRLARHELPQHVRVLDFGIRGLDLAYALMDDYEAVILVDAVPRGEQPGTLYTIEPDLNAPDGADSGENAMDPHAMNPMKVLALTKSMGGRPKRLLLVGCEPSPMPDDEERMGLSEPVEQALEQAVKIIERLIGEIEGGEHEQVLEGGTHHGGSGGRRSIAARH